MARMETDSNLKTSGRFFQVFALVSQIKLVKTDLASFFFQNSKFYALTKVHFNTNFISKFATKIKKIAMKTAPEF